MNDAACAKCGQPPKFKCERCLEPYCSSECQVIDWQDHKGKCYKLPNLIPMHIMKSTSTLSLKSDVSRRPHGSTTSLNESKRNSNSPLNTRSRNPIDCNDASCVGGAKPKKLLDDEDFALVPKTCASPPIPVRQTNPAEHVAAAPAAVATEKVANWRSPFPPSTDFFDVLVQFVEEIQESKRFVWVTDVKYDKALQNLLADINRNISLTEPYNPDLIVPGALVAAPLNKILYRAEVLEVSPEAKRANIRLIDYGNELRVPYNQIFEPIPIMVNLNAYAFRVCLPNDCGPLELESLLTIRVVGQENAQGYYNVECKAKSIPMQLDVESLTNEKSLTVVKCFVDGKNALLRLSSVSDLDLDVVLNSAQTLQYDFERLPTEGTFVAARTGRNWKRACFLGFYEKGHQFLVYTIDEGSLGLSPQIKRIPDAFLSQPMRVFAISTSSPDLMLSECVPATAKNLSLQLLPSTSVTVGKDPKTHLSCALFADKRKIIDIVVASVFTGRMDELGLKSWHDAISENASVFISNVITYKEIYIASSCSKDYPTIIQSEYSKCSPFDAKSTIAKGDVVIVNNPDGSKYRGEIISYENNTYKVIYIDRGTEGWVDRKTLSKPTQLLRSLPVRCSLVKLIYLESIPTPVANNKALAALESCMENGTEFCVTYAIELHRTVDLLFQTKERQSLCKKLIPMVFEPRDPPAAAAASNVQTEVIRAVPSSGQITLPATPPDTPIESKAPVNIPSKDVSKQSYFTLNDLELIPITCGEKTSLYVLDASSLYTMQTPYITAADYDNKEFLAKMQKYLSMVGAYCTGPQSPKGGYAPKKLELCLSVFADDGEWYRALCIGHLPNDMFEVMFLDFGNRGKVNKKDIMPIPQELLFPANANSVYVEGITSKEQAVKFLRATQENPIICAKVELSPDDEYVAKVHNLESIIG